MLEEMKRRFKGIWIPAELWLSKDLTSQEKIFIAEVDSLCNEQSGCYASNKYFAEFFGISADRVSKIISHLVEDGYLHREIRYKEGTKEIESRMLRPLKVSVYTPGGIGTRTEGGIGTNAEDITKILYNKEYNNILPTKVGGERSVSNENRGFVTSVVNYLNERLGTHYRANSKATQRSVLARKREGYSLDDFKRVIDTKIADWGNDPKMRRFLNPDTLFAPSKFEKYLNQQSVCVRPKATQATGVIDGMSMEEYERKRQEQRLVALRAVEEADRRREQQRKESDEHDD